jgi:hypothetical protein
MKGQELVGRVVVGIYQFEQRRIKVEEVQDIRGRAVVVGFDMDRGTDTAAFLDDIKNPKICSYKAEAARTRSRAAIVIDDGRRKRIVSCRPGQDSFCRSAREMNPEAVVYPISAAI